VCHGLLLGLAINGDLILWDHDKDIAVLEGEYTEEYIVNIFESMDFRERAIYKIHFKWVFFYLIKVN
jgi:hypothetical protein